MQTSSIVLVLAFVVDLKLFIDATRSRESEYWDILNFLKNVEVTLEVKAEEILAYLEEVLSVYNTLLASCQAPPTQHDKTWTTLPLYVQSSS